MVNEDVLKNKTVERTFRDGKRYTVRPLPLNKLIEIWPIIEELDQMKSDSKVSVDVIKKMRKLAFVVLKESNKDITSEKQVGDLIDLADIKELIAITVGQNKDTLQALIDSKSK
jgi:hypothetical protein